MLTIRVNGIHGCEQVFQAATVIRGSDAQRRGEHGMIEFYGADNRPAHEPVFFGAVYVMNDSGKTVADYNLGGWELADPPLPSQPPPPVDERRDL